MRLLPSSRVSILCCIALVFVAGAAAAAGTREISLQEAVAQAQKETQGKVLSAQTLTVGKRKVYRIKTITRDGRVRIVQVPAEQNTDR